MSPGHLDRLRDAMAPDPGEWRFTGRVNDTGVVGGSTCSCGQDIRYEFIIARTRDDAQLIIGSHCIETSVPYLIEAGAGLLADELQDAYRSHRRELDRERRDENARRALGPAKTDLHRLRQLLQVEQRRFGAEATARGQEVILLPRDIRHAPEVPADADTPGRTLGSIRRSNPSAWLRVLRYAHEHGVRPPELPREPVLRERLGERVVQHAQDPRSEFQAACHFARLVYHGDDQARNKVPPPRGASSRKGLTGTRRPMQRRPTDSVEFGFTRGAGNPLLDQALKRAHARDPDAARRWQVLQDAKGRAGKSILDGDATGRPPRSSS